MCPTPSRSRLVHESRHVQAVLAVGLCTGSVTDLAQEGQAGTRTWDTNGWASQGQYLEDVSGCQTPSLVGGPDTQRYPHPYHLRYAPDHPSAVHRRCHAVGTRCTGRLSGSEPGTAIQGLDQSLRETKVSIEQGQTKASIETKAVPGRI